MSIATAEWSQPGDSARLRERYDQVAAADTEAADPAALLALASAGNQQAWNRIVEQYTNLLWSVGRAHRLDTMTINDVIQTTWLRLLENLSRIREPERLAGWLATTARRECLAELRRSGREPLAWDEGEAAEIADDIPPLDHLLITAERDLVLWRSFEGLAQRCQALLRVLMATDQASYAEVSAAMGLPIGSIGPTRLRCLRRLRELAAESGYPFDGNQETGQ